MQVTLGEGMSLAVCNRLVLTVQEQVKTFQTPPLEALLPLVLVYGLWIKIASPTGEITDYPPTSTSLGSAPPGAMTYLPGNHTRPLIGERQLTQEWPLRYFVHF